MKIIAQSKVCATLKGAVANQLFRRTFRNLKFSEAHANLGALTFQKILNHKNFLEKLDLRRRLSRLIDKKSHKKRIVFGIGSNIGDRNFYLEKAVLKITQQMFLTKPKTSKILKNPALLLPNSPKEWNIEFFNIAFSADINLKKFPPQKILEIVKKVENHLGRKDRGKWAPREIDIDILLIEDLKIDLGEELKIPHRELFNRDFFIKTIQEIEPELLKKATFLKK